MATERNAMEWHEIVRQCPDAPVTTDHRIFGRWAAEWLATHDCYVVKEKTGWYLWVIDPSSEVKFNDIADVDDYDTCLRLAVQAVIQTLPKVTAEPDGN